MKATAKSYSNIAFIKYWGNRDHTLRLPVNGSISMNLEGLETVTTVIFDPAFKVDTLSLNGTETSGTLLERVSKHLDHIRALTDTEMRAHVKSQNNFPMGAGIASSASAFSALTVAACAALSLNLPEPEISRLARLGSGSACRSIPAGFVEWHYGNDDATSVAESIAPAAHWDVVDLVAVVSDTHKLVGSTGGHKLASTSPLQAARVADTPRRLDLCRKAILEKDFDTFAEVVEQDTLIMHSVMMTSEPALMYWSPSTLAIIELARHMRQDGVPVCFTIDAGPNVHLITPKQHRQTVRDAVQSVEGVLDVLEGVPGGPAHVL